MLLALPLLLPLLTAIALQLLPHRPKLLRSVAFGGALGILIAAIAILVRVNSAGIQVLQIGSWPAPFGITLVADLFSALLVVMVGILGSVITGLLVGVVEGFTRVFYPEASNIVVFVIMAIVLMIRPAGLFGAQK